MEEVFKPTDSIEIGRVIETYIAQCEEVDRVHVAESVKVNGESLGPSGFMAWDRTIVITRGGLLSLEQIESVFILLGFSVPKSLHRSTAPTPSPPTVDPTTSVFHSRPCSLSGWDPDGVVPLRQPPASGPADYHVDVSAARASMGKYLRRPLADKPTLPLPAEPPKKKVKDAREFRETILSNGAQGEFYVWSLIQSKYGESADLSWWLTSTKRQFFPQDATPIDDSLGADFRLPSDSLRLFAHRKGATVLVEVKGAGRASQCTSFEISRNELRVAEETEAAGDEYVVVVVSGLGGMGRPQIDSVVRDVTKLEMTPSRFICQIPGRDSPTQPNVPGPPLTSSNWY
jgi:hypothetical protein